MAQHPPSTPERFPKKSRTVFETLFTGRRLPISLLVLLAIGAGAYSAWWFWLAGEARARFESWVEAEQAEGRNVSYENYTVSGFPGPLVIYVDTLRIDHIPGGWTLSMPAVDVTLKPWKFNILTGSVRGPANLSVRTGPATGVYQLRMTQNTFRAVIRRAASLDLAFQGVDIQNLGTGETLRADNLTTSLTRGSVPIYATLELEANGITLPATLNAALGDEVKSLQLRIDASGADLPSGLNANSLEAWRVNGGAFDVTNLSIIHGPLGMKGAGTFALDGNLQPVGAFTAKITGYNAAIDALSRIKAIPPGNAAIAKIVLGAIAKVPNGGGPKMIEVPLTAQDRYLSVGPVQLLRLPRIVWPDR
mgnify:CR=1 FL=1|tara:strand:+ start:44381 stop:45469 length:1089 start_codon:yes stop_codon:yes gene_type:complete